MNYRAGFLAVACAWMGVLIGGLHAGCASCRLKELEALACSLVGSSLEAFDKANGEHLGTWAPGFPELQVNRSTPLNRSKVQCDLLFMAQGLKEVLADQRDQLNPKDKSLHQQLASSIFTVDMLAPCTRHVLGGSCKSKPPPPEMPRHAFERKQWSHTLLKTAGDYLDWMQGKRKASGATTRKHLEGSGYLL